MSTIFALDDPLLYADMREALHLGAEVLYDAPDGLLLRRESKLFASGEGAAAQREFLESGMVLVHEGEIAQRMMREARFTECLEVVQLVYTKDTISVPDCGAEIRALDMAALPFLMEHYHHPNAKAAYLSARLHELMLGAFFEERMLGFAGVHEEGAMGMLEVLPEFRKRGVGRSLLATLIQRQLLRGSIPYSHAKPENVISQKLQLSMGMQTCKQSLYWLYKPVQFPR